MLFLPPNCCRRTGLYLGIAAYGPHGFDIGVAEVGGGEFPGSHQEGYTAAHRAATGDLIDRDRSSKSLDNLDDQSFDSSRENI